jgi:hypothetical protein
VCGALKAQRTTSPTRTSSLLASNMLKLWCARAVVVAAMASAPIKSSACLRM